MAITFKGIPLADSAADGFDGASGSSVSATDARQIDDLIRSTAPFLRGRGNRRFTIRFTARKRHASASAAKAFLGSHADALAGEGTFSGFGLTLAQAVCDVTIQHEAGLVTRAEYTITGAKTPTTL